MRSRYLSLFAFAVVGLVVGLAAGLHFGYARHVDESIYSTLVTDDHGASTFCDSFSKAVAYLKEHHLGSVGRYQIWVTRHSEEDYWAFGFHFNGMPGGPLVMVYENGRIEHVITK
jgi:hypothetical protein